MDQNLEWLSSKSSISYPFVNPVGAGLKTVVDALVIDGERVAERVKITQFAVPAWLSGVIVVELEYADSLSPFFTGAYVTSLSLFGAWGVIRLYSDTERKEVLLTVIHADVIGVSTTEEAEFVVRIQEPGQETVRSITFTSEEDDGDLVENTVTGDLVIAAGYNVSLGTGPAQALYGTNGDRKVVPITLTAAPGTGSGLMPNDCEGDGQLRTLNGVSPNANGDFQFVTKDCHRIAIPNLGYTPTTIVQDPYKLQLANDCISCCSCDDYERVYELGRRVYNSGSIVGKTLSDSSKQLGKTMEGMEDERSEREVRRKTMDLTPPPGWMVTVNLQFINNPPGNTIDITEIEYNLSGVIGGDQLSDPVIEGIDITSVEVGLMKQSCYVRNTYWKKQGWIKLRAEEMFSVQEFGDAGEPIVFRLFPGYVSEVEDPEEDPEAEGIGIIQGTHTLSASFTLLVKPGDHRWRDSDPEADPLVPANVDLTFTEEEEIERYFIPIELNKVVQLALPPVGDNVS